MSKHFKIITAKKLSRNRITETDTKLILLIWTPQHWVMVSQLVCMTIAIE